MNEPWFDPTWAWLPGTAFGCLTGLWGSLARALAPRGRLRTWILGSGIALFTADAMFLIASTLAWLLGQPYAVWHGLLLPGVLGVILMPMLLPAIWRRYSEAETRRIQATDFE